eukprot:scaffold83132_cov86-Cyclotella_meneghiniana.AAC.2
MPYTLQIKLKCPIWSGIRLFNCTDGRDERITVNNNHHNLPGHWAITPIDSTAYAARLAAIIGQRIKLSSRQDGREILDV